MIEQAVKIGTDIFAQERKIDLLTHWRTKLVVYDYAFHSGAQAIKDLQRVLGLKADGVIGPDTLAAEASSSELTTALRVLTEREEFMQDIMQRNQTQRKYLLGWWRRTTALQSKLLEGL
jgi:lysozyme family protein